MTTKQEIENMSRKQQKELGIKVNQLRKMVCNKNYFGCSIMIELGDLFHPQIEGSWNRMVSKSCLNCHLKELNEK